MNYVERIKEFVATHKNMDFYTDRACEREVVGLLNYDESAILPYTVESPLLKADGSRVASAEEWKNSRRQEIIELFKNELYGAVPPMPDAVEYKEISCKKDALNGKAVRKEIDIVFKINNGKQHTVPVLLYFPADAKGKVPVFINLNFKGNHTITSEKDVRMTGLLNDDKSFLTEEQRSCHAFRNSIEMVIARGYGCCTASYNDFFPDHIDGWSDSIYSLFGDFNGYSRGHEKYSSIGAWAWGCSRLMDLVEEIKEFDSSKTVLHGHSRLGKTALWAGALDERFKIVIANNSGLGGAAMTKRRFGELYVYLVTAMPHWFIKRTAFYIANEEAQNFDQHFLMSLIAPRKLVVASAENDIWSDPYGEYLGAFHAGEVYSLFGADVLKSSHRQAVGTVITSDISYHIRPGKHAQNEIDWLHYLDIADKFF
ncbi:MAG: acetylxylan esterase [Lentisphaeria bacterium]|nr:acetylxylan esterase [Lentisphaeria bacterium]